MGFVFRFLVKGVMKIDSSKFYTIRVFVVFFFRFLYC